MWWMKDKIQIDGSTIDEGGFEIKGKGAVAPDPAVLAAQHAAAVDKYEKSVDAVLNYIYFSECEVGAQLIDEIGSNTGARTIVIKPRTADDILRLGENAEVDPVVWKDAAPSGVVPFAGAMDDASTKKIDERFQKADYTGTGQGTSVRIPYNPGDWSDCGATHKMGAAADDMLVHELFHALRMMQGKDNPVPTADPHQDNEEEWLAVLITNIYMAEKGDYPLRASHHGLTALAHSLSWSKGFLLDSNNLHLMMNLWSQNQPLFNVIANKAIAQPLKIDPDPLKEQQGWERVQVLIPLWEFNPLRLYRDNRRYFELVMARQQANWLKEMLPAQAPSSPWGSASPSTPGQQDMFRGTFDRGLGSQGGLELSH